MDRLEATYNQHFNTLLNLLTTEQHTLTQRFFETLAKRVIEVFETANQEAENWLKSIMSPMETQVREHQMQLRRRLESVKRIHKAADTLQDRIQELEQTQREIQRQLRELAQLKRQIELSLEGESDGALQRAA